MRQAKRILSVVLTLCMVLGMSPIVARAEASPAEQKAAYLETLYAERLIELSTDGSESNDLGEAVNSGYIQNEYVEAYIDAYGQFTMGTVGGDPNSDTDNYSTLLFGHPYPWSSETLVRVDGVDYIFDEYVTSVTFNQAGTQCVATANISDIQVQQILTLTTNPYTQREDLVSIRYTYVNNASTAKQVGIRIMLDTMLGYNDGAPFRVNGQDITTEVEYSGNNVPQYWQSFDSLEQPNVTSSGFFYFSETEKPDKVQFAYWASIKGSSWNYTVSANQSVTWDSAVAAYFNPRTVFAGGSNSVVTYYGISGFSSDNTDLDSNLSVRITAPSELYGSDMIGGYLNNPFAISVYLNNPSGNTLSDMRAVLSLANAPQLVLDDTQSTTIRIGDMYPGGNATAQWTLRAIPQGTSSVAQYTVSFYSGDTLLKTMPLQLNLTELNEADMYRTVTFDLNGGSGATPAPQRVLIGSLVEKPQNPTREGYSFVGWYANRTGSGMPWFNLFNLFKGNFVTEDVTLYARWSKDTKSIDYFEDTFSFSNSYGDFWGSEAGAWSSNKWIWHDDVGTYKITGDYYDILMEDLGGFWVFGERYRVKSRMDDEWGGSCFGMSAVLSLVRAGALDVEFFQKNAETLYDFTEPKNSTAVNNLINYYHLMQYTNRTYDTIWEYSAWSETDNNREIVEQVKNSDYPVVITFKISKDGKNAGGHAVVGYDCEYADNMYKIHIWDPNDQYSNNYLYVSSDYKTSYFDNQYDDSGYASFMVSALTVEDGDFDYKNVQEELIDLGNSNGYRNRSTLSNGAAERVMQLQTNYDNFTISCSDGTTAVIENGVKVSGDLDISDGNYINEPGCNLCVIFAIAGAATAEYTIVPVAANNLISGLPLDVYETSLLWNHAVDGFYSELSAAGTGTVTFGADGTLTTEFDNAVSQKITVVANDAQTSWYAVTVESNSTGLTVTPGTEETTISSQDDAQILVSAEDNYNTLSFDSVQVSASETLSLEAAPNNVNAGVLGEQEQQMGHALIFYTQGGTPIEAQTNIPHGNTAVQPENPTRAGFVFDGWYFSEDCADGFEWDFTTPITEDVRIYAKWLVDDDYTHVVTFRAEGQDDIIFTVMDGASLSEDQIPKIPERVGFEGEWDITDFSNITADMIINAVYAGIADVSVAMQRLYNPNSGEHFYTGSTNEREMLEDAGWHYEGISWNAPVTEGDPVYRVYNPNSGDHHYTMDDSEVDMLVGVGWIYEGVAWNSAAEADGIAMYRLWNPNADCGSHHYTSSEEERDWLVSLGWILEGIGWYGTLL